MSELVIIKHATNGVTTLTLNRPDQHNAMNEHLIASLSYALNQCRDNPSIKVIVLNANGPSFCSGADLNTMQRMVDFTEQENIDDALSLASLLRKLYEYPKPTIASIQGPAYGGGLGLVACCDLAIATEDVHFCFSEVKLGLIPAMISPYVVVAMGTRICQRYFLTAERFSATQALKHGLIQAIAQPLNLEVETQVLVDQLLKNSPAALTACKTLLRDLSICSQECDRNLATRLAQIRVSEEAQEGLCAFLEKRVPNWRGSLK